MVNDFAAFFELLALALAVTLIGGVILKVSCILYNLLACVLSMSFEPPNSYKPESKPVTVTNINPPSVPRPSIEQAMCIVFVAALLSMMAEFIAIRLFRFAGFATGISALRSLPLDLLFFVLAILIHSHINAVMLPTTFGKGLLVALIHVPLSVLVLAVFAFAVGFVAAVYGLDLSWLFDW